MTIHHCKYLTARRAARQPVFIYRDSHDNDVTVLEAAEEGGGRRVALQLADGRRVTVDWDHKLRVVGRV